MTDRLHVRIRRATVTGHGPLPAARLREALERALAARLDNRVGYAETACGVVGTDEVADRLAARTAPSLPDQAQ